MDKRNPVLWLVMILSAFFLLAAVAVPLPPKILVNHTTRECATVILGDECVDCLIPAGWEELGLYGDVSCPEGYSGIDLKLECQPFKISRCCSESHSGAPGDCEDLVVNRLTRQCAFVEDINAAQLSGGWSTRPEDVAARDWVCPRNFTWQEEILVMDGTQPGFPVPNRLIPVPGLVCLCGFSLLAFLVVLLLILRKIKKASS